jgi:hypothetical protein
MAQPPQPPQRDAPEALRAALQMLSQSVAFGVAPTQAQLGEAVLAFAAFYGVNTAAAFPRGFGEAFRGAVPQTLWQASMGFLQLPAEDIAEDDTRAALARGLLAAGGAQGVSITTAPNVRNVVLTAAGRYVSAQGQPTQLFAAMLHDVTPVGLPEERAAKVLLERWLVAKLANPTLAAAWVSRRAPADEAQAQAFRLLGWNLAAHLIATDLASNTDATAQYSELRNLRAAAVEVLLLGGDLTRHTAALTRAERFAPATKKRQDRPPAGPPAQRGGRR